MIYADFLRYAALNSEHARDDITIDMNSTTFSSVVVVMGVCRRRRRRYRSYPVSFGSSVLLAGVIVVFVLVDDVIIG